MKIAMSSVCLALALCTGCDSHTAMRNAQAAFPHCAVSAIPGSDHNYLAYDGTNVWLVESWGFSGTGNETAAAIRRDSIRMFGNGP